MEALLNRLGYAGALFLGTGVFLTRFVFVVDGGERAVIFNRIWGVQPTVYGEGMHFRIPIIHVYKLNLELYRLQESLRLELSHRLFTPLLVLEICRQLI